MNKRELINVIAEETGEKTDTVARVLSAFTDAVQIAVAAGDRVTLVGFGSFEQSHRSATTARNPKTKELIQVAAKAVPVFRPGGEFKELVIEGGRQTAAA